MSAAAGWPADAAIADAGRSRAGRIGGLLHEIDALIERDEAEDRGITGGWQTFEDVVAASQRHAWDAYSVDLSVDAANYRALSRRRQKALLRVFATIYRAESVVDDWMVRIVAALPRDDDAMRIALQGQEHDEKMHRGSLLRVATEVLGIRAEEVDRIARRNDNFVAEALFTRFDDLMRSLLRPGRSLEDVYTAIFIYGILSEDVVANSDVVIRRAKGTGIYDAYDLPGLKLGQTNVRRDEGRHVRIAVLATRRFLDEHESAAARLMDVCRVYLDLADRLLRRAKASHGLIDLHLAESYGPEVNSLYYYVMNMKRLAVRLDELGLRDGVADIRRRVEAAVSEFTGEDGEPVVALPGRVLRTIGPPMLKLAGLVRAAD